MKTYCKTEAISELTDRLDTTESEINTTPEPVTQVPEPVEPQIPPRPAIPADAKAYPKHQEFMENLINRMSRLTS